MQQKSITVQELYEELKRGGDLLKKNPVYIAGWVRTNRASKAVGFLEINDGSAFKCVQVVYEEGLEDFEKVSHYLTGACVGVHGEIVLTPEMKQPFEIHAKKIDLLGDVAEDYPLQKKRMLANLRDTSTVAVPPPSVVMDPSLRMLTT